MDPARRAFYQYHASLMEPWDGPASMTFTDGTVIGAVLDRNGLRPSRIWVTDDGLVVMASEAGVLNLDPSTVVQEDAAAARPDVPGRHRAGPHRRRRGDQGRARRRAPVSGVARRRPVPRSTSCRRATTSACLITGSCCASRSSATPTRSSTCWWRRWRAPAPSRWARWAPTPRSPCCRSGRGCSYDYFQQLFAQVTNPPLDAIREEVVTSLQGTVGPEGDLLNPTPDSCRQIVLPQPILRNAELSKLICVDPDHEIRGHKHGMRAAVIRCLYPVNRGGAGPARRRSTTSGPRCRPPSATARASSCCPTASPTSRWRRSRRC